jgi:hypothetical protein
MTRKDYFLLYLLSAVFYAVLTFFVQAPGYMDAEYYYAGGIHLVSGTGLSEPYLWNYLSNPDVVPVHAFSYWMPLTSLVSAAGMWLTSSKSFTAARLLFILAAGCVPLVSAWMAEKTYPKKGSGWLAGVIALFSVYYLIHLTTTDSFALMMILGSAFLVLIGQVAGKATGKRIWWPVIGLGLVSGLIHLTRADGLIWLLAGLVTLVICVYRVRSQLPGSGMRGVAIVLVFLGAYLLVTGAWYLRNLSVFQSLFPPGNNLMLFAVEYDDIFFFNTEKLTLSRMVDAGVGQLVSDRFDSLLKNLLSFVGVNGSILLSPFILVGLWHTRREFTTRVSLLLMIMLITLMSFVFPFAGTRGGYFHSMAALQPFLWSLVPLGLSKVIELGVRKRKWQFNHSWRLLGATILAAVSLVSILVFLQKLQSSDQNGVAWNDTLEEFRGDESVIVEMSGDESSTIMVNDPPGYWLASGRQAIVVPSDGLDNLLAAAEKFSARFVIIEQDNQLIIEELQKQPGLAEKLVLLSSDGRSFIYEIR